MIQERFTPHIAQMIFQQMDQNTLTKSRLVSKVWKNYVDLGTPLWGKILPEQYIEVAQEGRLDICQMILQHTKDDQCKKNPSCEIAEGLATNSNSFLLASGKKFIHLTGGQINDPSSTKV